MTNAENADTPTSSETKTIFLIIGALAIMALFVGVMQWIKPDVGVDSDAATFSAVVENEPQVEVAKLETVSVAKPILPDFDLVRVDRDGAAVIAGAAAPNSTVRLLVDGAEVAVTQAGADGAFAFVTTMPVGTDPMQLQLEQMGDQALMSQETVLVMPSPSAERVTPKVVVAQANGDVVIQEQGELGPELQAPWYIGTVRAGLRG